MGCENPEVLPVGLLTNIGHESSACRLSSFLFWLKSQSLILTVTKSQRVNSHLILSIENEQFDI